jgi:hypothetical protein
LDEKERGSGKLLERGQREIFLEREIKKPYSKNPPIVFVY